MPRSPGWDRALLSAQAQGRAEIQVTPRLGAASRAATAGAWASALPRVRGGWPCSSAAASCRQDSSCPPLLGPNRELSEGGRRRRRNAGREARLAQPKGTGSRGCSKSPPSAGDGWSSKRPSGETLPTPAPRGAVKGPSAVKTTASGSHGAKVPHPAQGAWEQAARSLLSHCCCCWGALRWRSTAAADTPRFEAPARALGRGLLLAVSRSRKSLAGRDAFFGAAELAGTDLERSSRLSPSPASAGGSGGKGAGLGNPRAGVPRGCTLLAQRGHQLWGLSPGWRGSPG